MDKDYKKALNWYRSIGINLLYNHSPINRIQEAEANSSLLKPLFKENSKITLLAKLTIERTMQGDLERKDTEDLSMEPKKQSELFTNHNTDFKNLENRPLLKLATDSKDLEDQSVLNINKDLSTKSTQQSEVEFQESANNEIQINSPLHQNQNSSCTDHLYHEADKCNNLKELKEIVHKIDGCEIKNISINTVFSDGNPDSHIMLIGEAPGANEDRQGIPFCGQSGQLLDKILNSVHLNRSNVYITNVVFWRPPYNRKPNNEELDFCRPFVEKHISIIMPKLLILVGSTALESLLRTNIRISDMRGKFIDYSNRYLKDSIKTTCIFHPSYLLRQPKAKKLTWFDILKIKNFYNSMWI